MIETYQEPCTSTEDLLSRISDLNNTEDLSNCIVGSMDVKALYPSIDIDFSVDRCVELLCESEIEFRNIDVTELGLYLALVMPQEDLIRLEINQYCPTRKNSGKRPTITGNGTQSLVERWKIWNKSENTPDDGEKKKMVCHALGVAMKTTLKNHIFRFNDEIKKQTNGGAIGVKAAGDIAALFMVWWDKTFKQRVAEELKLYSRYVDDEHVVSEALPENETNAGQQKDERTMKKLQEVGNAIHPSIQLTVDYPSNHENGRMPVLDTEQWIEKVDVDGELKEQIMHSHYMKGMASKYLIHRESASPMKSKINILVADLIRVMRNVSQKCTPDERKSKVEEFIRRMQYSGYTKKERADVYKKAKGKYDEMIRRDQERTQPLYRSKNWQNKERKEAKKEKKKNWYAKDGSEAVFFVESTPDGILAESCRKEFKNAGFRVKVVERSGRTVKTALTKSNPFKKNGCDEPTCEVCDIGADVHCKSRDVLYRISCAGQDSSNQPCANITYIGETSRSIKERFSEHWRKMHHPKKAERKKSFIYDHMNEVHEGGAPPVTLEIVERFINDPGVRQAAEAVCIREEKPKLNGKEEWTNLPRKRREETTGVTSNNRTTTT